MTKRLVDPKWTLLLKNATPAERGDVFWAVLHYPDMECDHPAWPFIKDALDMDNKKYIAKCEQLAANRAAAARRNGNVSISDEINMISQDVNMKSNDIGMNSGAIAISKEQFQNNKTKHSNSIAANTLINKVARNFSPNRPDKYYIDDDFSFNGIANNYPTFAQILQMFPPGKVIAAEATLRDKCRGQEKTLKQIIGWIENEGNYRT